MDAFKEILPELEKLCVPLEAYCKLEFYLDTLWQKNSELNLFSRKMSQRDLVHLHLLDSLLGLPLLPDVQNISDLGTGGGFPAIPLALCHPNRQFTLIEKSVRKAEFLRLLSRQIPNIGVVCGLVPEGIDNKTQLVIARAFKPLPVILELTKSYRKKNFMLWKGRRAVIDEELKRSGRMLVEMKTEVKKVAHPTRQVERHILFMSR
ncbi:MAG: 16S rRNA (guanine(527)-N(7))-methyltransferase RsmG [Acidobacteria bacterium]|nr:MAG: 16S rRNA (guanine(527)-N(7))-methyltransferase RsmG [Acidobacteriota bacterium]